ncbi:thiol:disulfide interchange protein [Sphingomonas aracearum]|uniref:Thiol:disulfide interchange protein n=2 Tax=Sphingomonas aracearum TaxID=2283317 RepID=A0A369VVS4_9SPHN|nr:thiol:disulfide interchange protein [Sphingomonas aracearum]
MLVTMLLVLLAWPAAAQGGGRHIAMRLVAETAHPRAGDTVPLAIDSRPQPGWHGYWEYPGDAGFPATLTWTLPRGMTAGKPAYPLPTTLTVAGLMNYVYEGPFAPLIDLRVPAGLATGTHLPVRLHLSYLVCTETLCVPEAQDLALDLTVGAGAVAAAKRARFDQWRRAIPRPLEAQASYAVEGGRLRLAVPYPAGAPATDVRFFPLANGLIDNAAPQQVRRDGDRLVVETRAGQPAGRIHGVLRIGGGQGLRLSAVPGAVPAAQGWAAAAAVAFLGALLGGLILNVMPCVFPILSLKALSLARGHLGEGEARREALAYTGGVVLVCLALGGLILALRAGGAAVGWAFQLQDARVVALLLLLTVALALNLSGLFELPVPRFAAKGGSAGAFATGALAAFIATPCTGPFMGAALGAALVLPWPAALAVFAGLGLGLALPFLLLGFVPALRRRLPRPGGWMETFRRVLSVPMWLTALALGWVLGRQGGVDALTIALAGALAAGLLLWVAGARQRSGRSVGVLVAGVALVAVATTFAVAGRRPDGPGTASAGAERFSEAELARLRAEKRPVFAYFTADWCLTCKVNEKAAIETQATRASFAAKGIRVLVGDWTDGDPVLGRFIEAHNRAGVPLYLYYAPGAGEPRVLPQVLTPGMLQAL